MPTRQANSPQQFTLLRPAGDQDAATVTPAQRRITLIEPQATFVLLGSVTFKASLWQSFLQGPILIDKTSDQRQLPTDEYTYWMN